MLKFQLFFLVLILALLHFRTPPKVRVRAMAKLSAAFFHDESSITIGGTKVQYRRYGAVAVIIALFSWAAERDIYCMQVLVTLYDEFLL